MRFTARGANIELAAWTIISTRILLVPPHLVYSICKRTLIVEHRFQDCLFVVEVNLDHIDAEL